MASKVTKDKVFCNKMIFTDTRTDDPDYVRTNLKYTEKQSKYNPGTYTQVSIYTSVILPGETTPDSVYVVMNEKKFNSIPSNFPPKVFPDGTIRNFSNLILNKEDKYPVVKVAPYEKLMLTGQEISESFERRTLEFKKSLLEKEKLNKDPGYTPQPF